MSDQMDLALEEYKTLRQEILSSITSQYSILTFGAIAVGVLVNAVLKQPSEGEQSAAETLFSLGGQLVGIPLLCLVVVVMWMTEVSRMLRAGNFIRQLEGRLNSLAEMELVTWESTVHKGDGPDIEKLQFRLVALFFGTLALAFHVSGSFELWRSQRLDLAVQVPATIFGSGLVAFGVSMFVIANHRYRKTRDAWKVDTGPTYAMVATVRREDVSAFQQYEARVQPVLVRHGGRLQRLLPADDALGEVHLVFFKSQEGYESYTADEERCAHKGLLDGADGAWRLFKVHDV